MEQEQSRGWFQGPRIGKTDKEFPELKQQAPDVEDILDEIDLVLKTTTRIDRKGNCGC